MNIAVIPARGGSKRILRKNIKLFDGKPLIAHAITAAKESAIFEHLVVSTDDEEISAVAREWGAETPFVRPADLADDHAATAPVVAHAIRACQTLGWRADFVCCIYPGVPFIHTEDIRTTLAELKKGGGDYCFPITRFPSPIQRALRCLGDGKLVPFYPSFELTKTQDLETAYHDAGQFYWGTTKAWLDNPRIHSSGIGYIIPNWRVVDIDTMEDWRRAEMLFRSLEVHSPRVTVGQHNRRGSGLRKQNE